MWHYIKSSIIFLFVLTLLMLFTACGNSETKNSTTSMKCGAGKCGANMFDGNSALAKKKRNVLSQMREDDSRKECVINANSSKDVYECVRDSKTQKLSTKCGNKIVEPAMKCGAGKCGAM